MTAEGTPPADDGPLFCYRHPDRETLIRCGRCERPICTQCAVQGPVGFRCPECGRPLRDPLASFTPAQLAGGLAVSFGGGLLAAYISGQFGFFALFVAFFAGGLIAEAVTRVTGYKHGQTMAGVVYGGIIVGAVVAFWFANSGLIDAFLRLGAAAGSGGGGQGLGGVLAQQAFWAAIGAAFLVAGARTRVR